MLTLWKWALLPVCQQQAASIFKVNVSRVRICLGYKGRQFVRPEGEGKKHWKTEVACFSEMSATQATFKWCQHTRTVSTLTLHHCESLPPSNGIRNG